VIKNKAVKNVFSQISFFKMQGGKTTNIVFLKEIY